MVGLRANGVISSGTAGPAPGFAGRGLIAALQDEPALRTGLDAAGRLELQALSLESDPRLFFEGLLAFGARLERGERPDAAAVVYAAVAAAVTEPSLRCRAERGRDAILGRGALGPRAEFLLRGLARQASDPALLAGMAGAQAVFSATRLALLSRLASAPGANLLTRGFGARALAATGGFALEAPAFVATTRGANALLGRPQQWEASTLAREAAGGYLTLGALKLSGWGARRLLAGGATRANAFPAWFLEQSATLAGLSLGHALEARAGLRPRLDGATTLVDSLATLLQFHVGGRLLRGSLPRLQTLGIETQWRGEALALPRPSNAGVFAEIGAASGPAPALAGGPAPERARPWSQQVWMAAQLPGDPASLPVSGLRSRGSAARRPEPARASPRDGEVPLFSGLALPELPKECRCLVIEFRGEGGRGPAHEAFLQRLREGLDRNPGLEELRLRFPDGSVHFFHREGGRTFHETREGPDQARALESWNPYLPAQVTRWQVIAPWHPAKDLPALPQWLGRLRRGSGLTQAQVAERLMALTGEAKDYNAVSRYERSSSAAIPFRVLRALGELYGVDVRALVQASNQTRFPEIPAALWTTREYPLYLENGADLLRLRHFAEHDPRRAGFGWLVYASRKNPFRYRTTVDLMRETGLNSNAFGRLELERNAPSLRAIQGLARSLDLPEGELIRRANRSFFRELGIESLFPGRDVFVDPLADDARKLRAYAESPGSLGQLLFGYRKSLPDRPGAVEMSRRLGRHENYWGERELNKAAPDRSNWRDWYDLLSETGLPLDPLRPFLGGDPAPERSASVLFHEALRGEPVKVFAERTGFDRKGLGLLMGPSDRVVQPETILDLQRALPALRGDLFYRALRPELTGFFPEAARNPPVLEISREQVAEAMALNLGESLYAHRMERGVELAELAQRLGVSDNTLKNYESISVQIENPQVLLRAAEILRIDPRPLYLHYHPQILRLFRLADRPMDESEYRYWTRERAAMRDPGNLREKLYAAARDAGIADPEALGRRLSLSPGLARKYWQKIHPLTVEEIERLTAALPALSYREWYEHFQGHALAYFLGRRMDGSFDYSLPEGWSPARLEGWDLKAEVQGAVAARFPSPRAASEATGVGFLARTENLVRSLKDRSWTNDTIARISRGLHLDRRLLYLYFRGEELGPMLEPRP